MGHPAFVGEQNPKKVTASQDDDSVVGIKNIGSSAKNTKRSKKSQGLGMTILLKRNG
jgi:carbohydrate-selective porin OprB